MSSNQKQDINYQELRVELDGILAKIQSDETDIDEVYALYHRGIEISGKLKDYLSELKKEIELKKVDWKET